MRWSTLLSVTACSLGLLGCVGKEESRSSTKPKAKSVMLLEPAELQNRLSEPGLRILDTRSKEDYDVGHVPNAVWVDVKSWQALGKRMGGFHDTEAWAERARARHGVAFVPGGRFAFDQRPRPNLRLGFARLTEAELAEAARRMAAALKGSLQATPTQSG